MSKKADASSEAVAVTVADVLAKHLSTEALEAAHVLSPQEAGHLRDFVTEPADGQQTFLEDVGGAQIFEAFVKVLLNWPNETDVRYVVTLVDELLRADASRAALFLQVKSARADLCVADALLRVVDRYADNAFLVARATHALSLVISTACKRGVVPEASRFIEWIMRTVQSPSPKTLVPALAALKELLKNDLLHDVFVHGAAAADADASSSSSSSSAEGSAAPSAGRNLAVLAGLLVSQAQNTQVVYEVGFSLWLLSYNASLLHLFREHRVIRALVGVIKSLLRVKVVRVALAALRNLLDKEKCNEAMIDAGLPRLLPVIGARLQQWDDEEITDDARAIEASLSKDIKELSSFEMYEREVMSGELSWSVVHTEKFWRENFQKFDKENFKLVRALVSLLTMKEDKVTLEVACFDLGEFARFHPNGKKVIQKIDGKSRLMNRMGHADAQVAKQALLAVQKLMVNNWEFLSKA